MPNLISWLFSDSVHRTSQWLFSFLAEFLYQCRGTESVHLTDSLFLKILFSLNNIVVASLPVYDALVETYWLFFYREHKTDRVAFLLFDVVFVFDGHGGEKPLFAAERGKGSSSHWPCKKTWHSSDWQTKKGTAIIRSERPSSHATKTGLVEKKLKSRRRQACFFLPSVPLTATRCQAYLARMVFLTLFFCSFCYSTSWTLVFLFTFQDCARRLQTASKVCACVKRRPPSLQQGYPWQSISVIRLDSLPSLLLQPTTTTFTTKNFSSPTLDL